MGDVGKSLTRKLGPLPVWAWALIAGIALYVYRQRHAAATGGGGGSQQAAYQAAALSQQPQTPQVLAPGESVYDPNTGALVGDTPGNGLEASLIGLIGALLLRKPPGKHPHSKHRHHPRPHKHHPKPHKHPKPPHHHSKTVTGKHKTRPKHGAGTSHRGRSHEVHGFGPGHPRPKGFQ